MESKQVLLLWLILPFAAPFPQGLQEEPTTVEGETTTPIETTVPVDTTTTSYTEGPPTKETQLPETETPSTDPGTPPSTTEGPPPNTETPPPSDCGSVKCAEGEECMMVKPNCTAPIARCMCLDKMRPECTQELPQFLPHCPEDHEYWLNEIYNRSFKKKMDDSDFFEECDPEIEKELNTALEIYHKNHNPYFVKAVEELVKVSKLNLCDPRRLMECGQDNGGESFVCQCKAKHPTTTRRQLDGAHVDIISSQCYAIDGDCVKYAAAIFYQFPQAMKETTDVYGDPTNSDHYIDRDASKCLANYCADNDLENKKCTFLPK